MKKSTKDSGGSRDEGKSANSSKDLARPLVVRSKLEPCYKAMAADRAREAEALEWTSALEG